MEITVEEGDEFPALRGETQTGEWFDLADVGAKRKVVYFYPKDNTPGCTIEAQTFNGSLADFEARNAVVIGVSADTADSHKSFCDNYNLTYTLVADKDAELLAQLGVLVGHQRIGEVVVVAEALVAVGGVSRDPDHHRVSGLEVGQRSVEGLCLDGAAGCVVLRVEVHDLALRAHVGEIEPLPGLGLAAERGELVALLNRDFHGGSPS